MDKGVGESEVHVQGTSMVETYNLTTQVYQGPYLRPSIVP